MLLSTWYSGFDFLLQNEQSSSAKHSKHLCSIGIWLKIFSLKNPNERYHIVGTSEIPPYESVKVHAMSRSRKAFFSTSRPRTSMNMLKLYAVQLLLNSRTLNPYSRHRADRKQ